MVEQVGWLEMVWLRLWEFGWDVVWPVWEKWMWLGDSEVVFWSGMLDGWGARMGTKRNEVGWLCMLWGVVIFVEKGKTCSSNITCLGTKIFPDLSRHLYPLWLGLYQIKV